LLVEEDPTFSFPVFLLPQVEGLCLEEVLAEAQQLCITVATTTVQAACPVCGVASSRVQSRYQRTVADLPWAESTIRLRMRVRRFRCENSGCPRAIFCERLGPAIAAYARRTQRLERRLQHMGLALGGEAGARQLRTEAIAVSPDTLLRLVRHLSALEVATPRVLGVDDWAWRRGQRYGTLLCDLEQHRVVDLLPDRRAETFAAWLVQHPGVEMISRDRAGNYAEGGRLGAPEAIQIADRWHLIQNLATALDPVMRRLGRSLKSSKNAESKKESEKNSSRRELRLTSAQYQRREQLRERFRQVQSLYEQGRSLREIAGIVEIDKNTLRYFIQSQPWAGRQSLRGRKARESDLAPYLPYLHKRWKAGCQNGPQLWRELRARGYTGSVSSVKPYVALLRQIPEDLLLSAFTKPEKATSEEAFSVRRIIWLTLSRPKELTSEQTQERAQACSLSAEVATALTQAQAFVKLLREKDVVALSAWLESAQASSVRELRQFAQGIQRDRAAVEAALSRAESNGQTEGQITRLKLIKRAMYGRARFDLLRLRVMHTA
jgi:transposase